VKSKAKENGFNFICVQSASGPLIIPYRLERSPRVKRMHMQIASAQFVLLKMPLRHAESRGLSFLQENGEWIRKALAAQPRVPPLREHLHRHPRVALAGRWHRLEIRFQRGPAQCLVWERSRKVVLEIDPRNPSDPQIVALLRDLAREYLPARLREHARRIRVKVHGVTVRDQKCRWGSCSETGGISLNWRLILIAPRLQDHVLLHELAHLRHFNHSLGFHAFLKSLDPRADEHARLLDTEASRIINLGRAEA
jgi:predicted metal-dependent hydrolase